MSSKFKYSGRTKEDVQRRSKQSSGRYDSYLTEEVAWFKPRAGENIIRIIPWLSGSDPDFDKYDETWGNHWGIDIIVHRNVGPDNGTYLCLDKMKGEPCPVCDAWHSDGIEDLKPSDRMLAWLIDRKDEKAGPQLWAMPLGTSKDISKVSVDKKTGELLLIDDWDEGFDVFFDREGEKARTRYTSVQLDRDTSPLAEDEKQQDRWLEHVFERRLPDLLKYYEADYLEKILSGQKERGDDDPDAARSSRSSSRRRDVDEGEGDREETAPRGRRQSSAEDGESAQAEPARSRGADREDREERPSRRARLTEDADESQENGRDRDAESANEGREARASRRAAPAPEEEPPFEADPQHLARRRGGDNAEVKERASRVGRRR